jgi:3-oxoacyl-[acyl-carrier protein] reductase
MPNLKGKVAIVTGASLGIGAGIAEKLAQDGAAVVVNYRSSTQEAAKLVSQIESKGGKALAVQADVSTADGIKTLFQKTIDKFGKVDILVNNAGVYEFLPITNVTAEHIDRLFNLNVKGLLLATQAAVQAFGDRGGSIINISSIVSLSPPPTASVYSATKGAVDAITKSLAQELGPKKILVNSVLPGATQTEGVDAIANSKDLLAPFVSQTPLGRIGQPNDIAGIVSFLASPDAEWITGQTIGVSGGLR